MIEEKKEEISLKKKIISFILTCLLLPILFMGTCIPLVDSGLNQTLFLIIFTSGLVIAAFVTKNSGIRWALIIATILTSIYLFQ